MKAAFLPGPGIASLLPASSLIAVNETWDGNSPNAGAGDSNVSTGLNWADDTAPVSDLLNTNLFFGGTTKLAPNFTAAFSANSIVFLNTSGAFVLGGSTITTNGIANADAQTQTINNNVTLGSASPGFQASSGALNLNGTLALGTNTLAVSGAQGMTFGGAITGTGTINKSGPGTLTLSNTTIAADVNISGGTVNVVSGGTTSFNSNSTVAINGGTFDATGNVTFDGAQLTRAAAATLNIAAGKTLTVRGGADAAITGTIVNAAASTIAITGTGSTLAASGGGLRFDNGTLNVLAGGAASCTGNLDFSISGGTSSATVDGAGSSLTGGVTTIGGVSTFGGTGTVLLSNGSTGALGALLDVANSSSAAAAGSLTIQSGATAAVNGNINVSSVNGGGAGTISITGAGSALTQSGAGTVTLGAASGAVDELNLLNGGAFTSGTGLTTVNPTGSIELGGGTFNANGDVTLLGGQMTRTSGLLNLAAGKTLTIQNGGTFTPGGSYVHNTASTITVTGAGSTINAASTFSLVGGSTLNVLAGAYAAVNSTTIAGSTGGHGTIVVDGASSSLDGVALSLGSSGSTGTATFSNGGAGMFGEIQVDSVVHPGSAGTLSIQSGATVTATHLRVADFVASNTGNVTITGAGSTLTLTSGIETAIGAASQSTATVNVQNGGTFNSINLSVNPTGTIAVSAGTFRANGFLTINGGQFTGSGPNALTFGPGGQMIVQAGGDAVFAGDFSHSVRAHLTVNGSGSTFTTAGNFSWNSNSNTLASVLTVTNGGRISSGNALHLAQNNAAVSLNVSGTGSQISAATSSTSEWQADVLLSFGASATLGRLRLADMNIGVPAAGSLRVESGATASLGVITAAVSSTDNTADISVSGAGSAVTQTGASTLTLGSDSSGSATLTAEDGGIFTSGSGTITLDANSTVNINGGTVNLNGPITDNGGTVNFTSGALNIVSNFKTGTGGLLGDGDLTFAANRRFSTTAGTTIDAFHTLMLDGGAFRTGTLTNNGALHFNSGTLGITGAGGFNIGTGALGSSVTLGAGANLQVTNATTVAGGAMLRVEGGSFAGGNVSNDGTIDHRDGVLAFTGTLTNNAAGRVFISGLASPAGTIANSGRITMQNGIGSLGGAGAITNTGLITGDGTIDKPVTNSAGGSIRAESGKTLTLTGAIAPNAGTLSLEGGTLEFATAITNSATGFISGRGALHTAGLTNDGVMAFSGGNTDVFGDVTLTGGARLVTSGAGSTTTFFDDVTHNGTGIFTGVNGSTVFFGAQSGAGSYTGGGTIYFIGDLRPGSSPAAINFAPQVVFAPSNSLTLEIGGDIAGTEHDKLMFTHAGTPQVEWGGTLVIELINSFTPAAGDAFDVLDFDAARDAGTFSSIVVIDHGLMPPGLAFNFDDLYTAGVIRVISTTGTTFAQWAAAELGNPGALPGSDHNNNGYDNLTEYALALHPLFPGASEPSGGFHLYPEGERMRVLFWRHIDRTDITIRVQVSTDLTNWTDLAVSVNSAPFTGPGFVSENRAHPLSEPGLVEVRDILNASGAARRYLRIAVTLSP